EQPILDRAKNTETPILIRKNDKFFIYGSKEGDGNWDFTEIKDENAVLKKLPFGSQTLFERSNELFSNDLIELLKKGHAYIYGQRVSNNLVGILSSAGVRNTRNITHDDIFTGLVVRLQSCFIYPHDV